MFFKKKKSYEFNDNDVVECLGYAMRQKEACERAGDETMPLLYMKPIFYKFLQARLCIHHLVYFGGLHIAECDSIDWGNTNFTCWLTGAKLY